MQDPKKFIDEWLNPFKDKVVALKVVPHGFKAIRDTLVNPDLEDAKVAKVSAAAAGIWSWVRNIVEYYDVVVTVDPKKQAVARAQAELAAASEKKAAVDALVAKLTGELAVLQEAYQKVLDEKNAAQALADKCAGKLDRANRLVNALGSERERWATSIDELGLTLGHITGDVLLASAFVSYVGPFNKKFRDLIIQDFKKYFAEKNIPLGAGVEPVSLLTDDAEVALWNSQGLPSDTVSVENGSILTKSERYPLIIDPQLQGIVWIKSKEAGNDL